MMTPHRSEHLSAEEFQKFQELLNHECGIFFHDDKRGYLSQILAKRLHESAERNFTEYYNFLAASPQRFEELAAFFNAVTVGETYFFRNPGQFEVLMKNILPEFIIRNQATRTLNIWSAGCSRGDEPYSIVIALLETIPFLDRWDINLVATDINTDFLEFAKRGIYNGHHLRQMPPEYIDRYFEKRGKEFVIDPKVKRLIKFVRHNLVKDPAPLAEADIIFCRNVIIYFDHSTIKKVIHRFFETLKGEGALFLGHAETLWHISDRFQTVEYPQTFIYKKSTDVQKATFQPFIELPRVPVKPKIYEPKKSPKPKPTGDISRAILLANEGKYGEAKQELQNIILENNLHAETYYLLGVLAYRMGDLNEAESHFRKVIYIDPQIELAYFNLGNTYLYRQKNEKAAREFKNAIRVLGKKAREEIVRFSEDFTVDFLITASEQGLEEASMKG